MKAIKEKSEFGLFSREEDQISAAEAALSAMDFGGDEPHKEFSDLLGGYRKLLRQTRRLMRISDRNEAELNKLNKSLGEQAEELREARDAAESATQAKDRFLATMSHEIRTPMNGVVGMIDLLERTRLDDDQHQMLTTIRESGYALLTIINDILDFSKIEAGKMRLEEIPIFLQELVEGVADILAPNARKKGIYLTCFVDPELPDFVIGDPVRVRQILLNLAGNAAKFTEQGGVIIRASPGYEIGDKQQAMQFEVIDSGIGMSDEAMANLFEPFTQADSSTTRRFGGTGLGLSITASLTEMMGGQIRVKSQLGQGTTFRVTLPLPAGEGEGGAPPDLTGLQICLLGRDSQRTGFVARYLEAAAAAVTRIECADEGAAGDVLVMAPAGPADEFVRLIEGAGDAALPAVVANIDEAAIARTTVKQFSYRAAPLKRRSLLRAVAMAAGRLEAEAGEEGGGEASPAARRLSAREAEAMGRLILVAEDNPTNRDVIARQLEALGHVCELVEDGRQALAALALKRYGLVLTDCHMPELDGYQLTAAIREHDDAQIRSLPVLAITANALQGEGERCLEAGMDGYLSKPMALGKLEMELANWLPPISPGGDESAAAAPTPEAKSEAGAPIDVSFLVQSFGDDIDMINAILKDFVGPAQDIANEVNSACDGRDAAAVAGAGHKLKSSARIVGAGALADLCFELESAGKADDWDTIDARMPPFRAELLRVLRHIEAL